MEIKNPYALFFSNLCLRVSAGTQINFQRRSCHAVKCLCKRAVKQPEQRNGRYDSLPILAIPNLFCNSTGNHWGIHLPGVILGAYLKVEMMAAVLISSLLQSIGFKMVWVIQSKMQMLCLTIGADGNAIDLLFLDIDLITTSGVDIGQYIRHRLNNYSMEIVFMCLLRRIMQSPNEQQIVPSVALIIVPIISIWSTA